MGMEGEVSWTYKRIVKGSDRAMMTNDEHRARFEKAKM